MEDNIFVAIITAIGTFIATIWGKDGWNFLIKKQEIEADQSNMEKMVAMQLELAEANHRTQQIENVVIMLITIFEAEFSDGRHKAVIAKAKEIISAENL